MKSPQIVQLQLGTPEQHCPISGRKPLYRGSHGSQALKKYSTPHCNFLGNYISLCRYNSLRITDNKELWEEKARKISIQNSADLKSWLLPCKAWAFWRRFQLESKLPLESPRQTIFSLEQHDSPQRYKQQECHSFWKTHIRHNKNADKTASFLAGLGHRDVQGTQAVM